MIIIDKLNELLCNATSIEIQRLIASSNHIGVYWNSSFKITVSKIPELVRRKGLWITYIAENKEIITREYFGDDDVMDIDIWGDENNWRGVAASASLDTPEATALSVDSGDEAAVELVTSGSENNKKLSFTFYIPKGKPGEAGEDGNKGTDGNDVVFEWNDTQLRVGTRYPDNTIIWGPYVQLKGNDGTTPVPNNYQVMRFKSATTQPDAPTGTSQNPAGWTSTPTAIGMWWMSIGEVSGNSNLVTSWSIPVRVTGIDGEDGEKGDAGNDGNDGNSGENGLKAEFRYANNTTPNTAPSIVVTNREPVGWSTTPVTLGENEFMWMTFAYINIDDTLNINWSNPVRISGEKGPIGNPGPSGQDGEDGQDGKKGQIIYTAGVYDSTKEYITDEHVAPVVIDTSDPTSAGGRMYVLNRQMSWIGINQTYLTPYLDFQANGSDASWIAFSMFEAIYTKLLIAENGTIGSMVFNGDYIFSQTGLDALDNEVTTYQNFDHNDPLYGAFRPYWFVNLKTGYNKSTKSRLGFFEVEKDSIVSKYLSKWETDPVEMDGWINIQPYSIRAGNHTKGIIGGYSPVQGYYANVFSSIYGNANLGASGHLIPSLNPIYPEGTPQSFIYNSDAFNVGVLGLAGDPAQESGESMYKRRGYDGLFPYKGIRVESITRASILRRQSQSAGLLNLNVGDFIILTSPGNGYSFPDFSTLQSQLEILNDTSEKIIITFTVINGSSGSITLSDSKLKNSITLLNGEACTIIGAPTKSGSSENSDIIYQKINFV